MRYLIGMLLPANKGFPIGTLTVNLLGCFFLAWLLTITKIRWKISLHLKLALGTGFTGAFTTFSSFSFEILNLITSNHLLMALSYLFLSVFGGIGLAFTGYKLATLTIKAVGKVEGELE